MPLSEQAGEQAGEQAIEPTGEPTIDAAPFDPQASLPGASRVQQVMRGVVSMIREKGLKVGDQLPSEVQLSRDLGISRPVIREAFGALAALGVVDVGSGRRPRVAAVNAFPMVMTIDHALHTGQVTFVQIWEVRRRLEMGTAAMATLHRTDEQAQRILALVDGMAACPPSSPALTRLDIEFHAAVASASGNFLFEQIAISFHPLMERAVPLAWATRTTEENRLDMLNKHRQVAAAIAARDPAAAEQAMARHFDQTIADLVSAMELQDAALRSAPPAAADAG